MADTISTENNHKAYTYMNTNVIIMISHREQIQRDGIKKRKMRDWENKRSNIQNTHRLFVNHTTCSCYRSKHTAKKKTKILGLTIAYAELMLHFALVECVIYVACHDHKAIAQLTSHIVHCRSSQIYILNALLRLLFT